MQIEQKRWTEESLWEEASPARLTAKPEIVMVFGAVGLIPEPKRFEEIRSMYPEAHLLLCSTAGEILGTSVSEHSLSLTAIHFEKTSLQFSKVLLGGAETSFADGAALADGLPQEGLAHVMVFSDGLKVNGTELVAGLTSKLPKDIAITGGLVGGGNDFQHTFVGLDAVPSEGGAVAIGFYGDALKVRYGAMGGWDPFGPKRIITKSKKNILYELDGRPALELYKEYLGEKSSELPGSGLLFPLTLDIGKSGTEAEVVRTILGINEEDQSITFAGDMPEGVSAQLMKANFDRLVGGAMGAAEMVSEESAVPELAILISCVGRKLVLKERVEEEIEAVQMALGEETVLAGFYSYGEISPITPTEKQCQLHNQTMTITTFSEN